jgi:crotonobetainyl-CoA:carnitine CoA-transferase CaiB-like acyl-CoA transferase
MIAGPYAGQLLGDLGADVVKIERPGRGELARTLEPTVGDMSFYYLTANRNKRSLALDVTSQEGHDAFMDLVEHTDVVIINFPPSFAKRYGIDYESVIERNEDIIYCSISAYGSTGPYRDDAGIDTTIQALSGSMSTTRTDETPPMRSGTPMNDVFASLYAAQGILAAYINRLSSGTGEHVDISMLDAGIAGLTTRATYSQVTEEPYPEFGQRHNYFAPEGVYEVSDGRLQLSVITDRHWKKFCEAIDATHLASDERFAEINTRVSNRHELDEILSKEFEAWTMEELQEKLRDAGIPVAPIHNTLDIWDHPQVEAREMEQTINHPTEGELPTIGFPIKYENIEPEIDRHPPTLGEHTKEVLRSAGYDDDTIEKLLDDEIIEATDS